MCNAINALVIILMLSLQIATIDASDYTHKISELQLYATEDAQVLAQIDGMMEEIVITAELPVSPQANIVKQKFNKLTDYLTFIANVLIIVFFMSIGIKSLLSKWKQRKNHKKEKGPFSLPPFSNQNIDMSKDYAC